MSWARIDSPNTQTLMLCRSTLPRDGDWQEWTMKRARAAITTALLNQRVHARATEDIPGGSFRITELSVTDAGWAALKEELVRQLTDASLVNVNGISICGIGDSELLISLRFARA